MRTSVSILSKDIRWVVALKAEARPIIKALNLYRINDNSGFPLYKDRSEMNWLAISGVGEANAGLAVQYLNDLSDAKPWSVWVNVGIAGASQGSYGELFLIDKIMQKSTKQCFYPGAIIKSNLRKGELLTVDEPVSEYSNVDLVDMEAAEFTKVASRISGRDLVVIMKVVSDCPSSSLDNLNKLKVSELISNNIPAIFQHIEKMTSMATIEKERFIIPQEYEDILIKWHFTVSQTHELRKLIKRVLVACPSVNVIEELKGLKNAREVINYLKDTMDNYEIDWNKL